MLNGFCSQIERVHQLDNQRNNTKEIIHKLETSSPVWHSAISSAHANAPQFKNKHETIFIKFEVILSLARAEVRDLRTKKIGDRW